MISLQIKDYLERSSWIRKMFEEGIKLKKTHGEDQVLDLTLGNPDLPPPPQVKEALQKIIETYEPSFHRYMPNSGFPFVREMMAKKVSIEQGVMLTYEDVIMTCGAAGALNIIFKTLLNPGEEVIFPSPFFVEYLFYTENHQGIPKPVSTYPDFSLNLEALDQNITEKTKIVLINSPNNPTGQIYTEEEIKSLAKLLSEKSKIFGHPIYLVSDEPYRNLVFDNHQVPSIFKHYPNSLIAYSFSKELSLAGERIGFVAVHPEIQSKKLILEGLILCNRILGFVNAPALAQRLAAECAFAKVETNIYQRRRDLICEMLQEAGLEFVKPKGGLFIFPKVPMDDVTFCQKLKEHLILAVPGRGFGVSNHIRLSFCVDEETLKRHKKSFVEAVKTILKYT
ncbi:pyridoxal phosphate-dependent aminotransferase [Thermodesulfobacterium commune]|uniref:Aminotransferase n=1 Tax=Thermodesulfobacterium commune DSM 2178 TaxID=289377 RepID=A0A075WTE2_9BACT|nr:pyridoxal phosphate-dependent aminotransferase [Thermodesulfobacterium commune]AIH03643.1 aspartate aminotransferase [Thermodesulfobacterium commune DSM 2178]